MPASRQRLSGDDPQTEQVWFSYFAAATKPLVELRPAWTPTTTKDANAGELSADPELIAAIQSIMFSALTLEYRMRRACVVLGVALRGKTYLGELLGAFWSRVADKPRLMQGGVCSEPPQWAAISGRLRQLVERRNEIAHVKYADLLHRLGPAPLETAKAFFCDVVEAIKLINIGIGYVSPGSDPDRYFDRLKLR